MPNCRVMRRSRRDADGSVKLRCCAMRHGRVKRQGAWKAEAGRDQSEPRESVSSVSLLVHALLAAWPSKTSGYGRACS